MLPISQAVVLLALHIAASTKDQSDLTPLSIDTAQRTGVCQPFPDEEIPQVVG